MIHHWGDQWKYALYTNAVGADFTHNQTRGSAPFFEANTNPFKGLDTIFLRVAFRFGLLLDLVENAHSIARAEIWVLHALQLGGLLLKSLEDRVSHFSTYYNLRLTTYFDRYFVVESASVTE